jgi:integrase
MPKAKGYQLNVKRVSRDLVRFAIHHRKEYVRRTVTMEALVAFLTGSVDQDSNLAAGGAPLPLEEFVQQKYLPFAAKPRLPNQTSLDAEADLVRALLPTLGKKFLHEITPQHAEEAKMEWLLKGRANSTVKRRLNGLRRVMDYAVSLGYIRENRIPEPKGLPSANRSDIWLNRQEIDRLLECCDESIRAFVEFLALTGARVGEALDFRAEDIRGEKILLPTEKQRKPPRQAMRAFTVSSMGPRFGRLLAQLKPNPRSGYVFYLKDGSTTPLSYSYLHHRFVEARRAAGLDHIHLHDLRGSYAIHRAMVVKSFRQLQSELGHSDAKSIQSYLDRAEHFDPKESIFYTAPGAGS